MDSQSLDIILKEYELVNMKIEQFISSQFSTLNMTLIAIGGFLFFVLSDQERRNYIKLLPILIVLMLSLVAYHYQRVLGLQGYKKYLEHQLNEIAEADYIFYSHLGLEYMGGYNLFSVGNLFLYTSIYIFSFVFVSKLMDRIEIWYYIAYAVLTGILVWGFINISTYSKEIEEISIFIHEDESKKTIDQKINTYQQLK